MCCILGFLRWSVGCIHRTLAFFLGCWLVLVVVYACALAIGAGVAYGYDYCMAEYATLARPNVNLLWEADHYQPERLVRRVGNISGIMASGDEFQLQQWNEDAPLRAAVRKPLPRWLYKVHHKVAASTFSTPEKREGKKLTKMSDVTDTAMNLRRAEQKLLPAIYAKQIFKPTVHRVLSSTTRNTHKVEMYEKVTEMYEKTSEVYNKGTDTTSNLRKAEQKFLPFIYAKRFSRPTLPPHLPFYLRLLSSYPSEKVGTDEDVTEMYKESDTSSSKPDVTTTMLTRTPSRSALMRKVMPESSHAAWLPTRSDTFFYKTPEDHQRRKTEKDSYYPEMKIRVFDRPSYGKPEWRNKVRKGVDSFEEARLEHLDQKRHIRKTNQGQLYCAQCTRTFNTKFGFASHIRAHERRIYEGLPMRYWETTTRTPEPTASSDDIDFKKFIYF